MRYKTLFATLCKLLGVYFFVLGLVGLIGAVMNMVIVMMASRGIPAASVPAQWKWYLVSSTAQIFEIGAGLYLFFNSRRVADLAIPGNRPYCPECGYDLTGNAGDICPECGSHRQTGKAA